MPIEQVYCTHCTYGTSALEQREGELADRVLGYSARAGSAERNDLRNDYRAIERFLYYYLPSDTPPEEKQRLDAAGAPRRLFFCPSMGRLQMVGQVAYRQYDTAGRLGSYFAHVLFADRAAGGWSTADCLRLWSAPWTAEDSPEHPFKLSPLERLDEVWAGTEPAVGDDALLHFLQPSTPPAEDNGGTFVGSRWQNMAAQQRIDLVANTLQGLLALGTQRRESILLVVEPDIAALVFYGVARLLPKSLAEGLSFSTYEPNAERLPVTLAATTFFDPQTADVRTDLYRRRGLVINTYLDRVSEGGVPEGNYARFIIEQLLEEGWAAVDRLREAFEAAGAKRPEDLEVLVPTHRVASQVLSASPPGDDSWRKSDLAARYLAREVQYQLATPPGNGFRLNRVVGTSNHLTVLELITCEPPVAGLQRPAQLLLKEFPPDRIAELVASPLLLRSAKLEALASYAGTQGRLPDGCQLLEEQGKRPKTRSSSSGWLLPDLLARLPEGVLRRVYEGLDEGRRTALLPALIAACKPPASPPAALKRLLLDVLLQLEDEALFDALVGYRSELTEAYPPPQPTLARRLGQALYELPDRAKDFETRLTVLDQWKAYFFYPNLAERRLGEWKKVRSCLVELGEREQKSTAGRLDRLKHRLRPPRPPDFKPLGEALAHAMPKRTSELDELAEVAEHCRLEVPQFKARLELASQHLGCPMTFDAEAAVDSRTIKSAPASGPQAELEQLQRRRQQQARMLQLLRELEERLWIYGDDASGKRKLQALQRIAQGLLGRSPLTVTGKQDIELYFTNGIWSTPNAFTKGKRRFKLKRRAKQPSWTSIAGAGLLIALLVPLIGYFVFGGRTSRVATNQTTRRSPATGNAQKKQPEPVESSTSEAADSEMVDESSSTAERKPEEEAAKVSSVADKSDQAPVTGKNGQPDGPNDMPVPEKADDGPAPETTVPTTPPSATTDKEDSPSTPLEGAAKEPTPDDSTQIVDEYHTLPRSNEKSNGALLKELHLSADTSPAEPGRIKLKLHGLPSANEWLKKHVDGQLAVVQQGEALQVAAQAGGTDSALAQFTAGGESVSFQWFDSSDGRPPSSACYTALRRCVLEAAGSVNSAFVSLSKPITIDELAFKAGTLTLDLRQLGGSDLEPSADDELLLGYGSVEVENERRFPFGDAASPKRLADIRDLPDQYRKSGAHVELARAAVDHEPRWLIRITSDNDPDRKVENRPARLSPNSLKDKIRILDLSKDFDVVDTAAKALATELGMDAPALPPPDRRTKEAKGAYKMAVDKVLRAAKERDVQLTQLDSLRKRAFKFSAVVYRRVTPTMYARYLVMGHPEPPATEKEATDDGQPAESN
ncbi:MAG TPA: hypothetical protein VG826_22620 [Pirellulales bacterium]|nr:hypothetical protein [Pirellulales bacterium]